MNTCLDFLVSLYEKGLSYSSLNTARSAISAIHSDCGTSTLINRFMKGIYNLRPGLPRYTCTYDIKTVLDHLDSIALDQASLQSLSRKLALLLLLLTGQRVQILKALDISNVHFTDTKCSLYIDKLMKTSRPGKHNSVIEFKCYRNVNLCVFAHLKKYLDVTCTLRGSNTQLFITSTKPYKPVTVDTLARWAKSMLEQSGVDITTFKCHSTRSAVASKSFLSGIPIHQILEAASWSNVKTFAQFYNKPIVDKPCFSNDLLETVYSV